jgi:hypothetical protein
MKGEVKMPGVGSKMLLRSETWRKSNPFPPVHVNYRRRGIGELPAGPFSSNPGQIRANMEILNAHRSCY